jgi:hypothetical protein
MTTTPGQHRAAGHPLSAPTSTGLSARATGSADRPATADSIGAKSATHSAEPSQDARHSHKTRGRGGDRQRNVRRADASASTRRPGASRASGADRSGDNASTGSSDVSSTIVDEPAEDHDASTGAQPPATTNSEPVDSAAGPSGLGGAVGGNCNPKCS